MQQSTLFPDAFDKRDEVAIDHKQAFKRIRNFLAGRFVGATRDESLLREVAKCLYIKLFVERHPEVLPSDFDPAGEDDTGLATFYRRIFAKVSTFYPSLFGADEELLLDPASLVMVMRELFRIEVVDAERDAVGDAFEVFIGSHIRGSAGQFFTPRNAVKLLVSAVGPSLRDRIIDPACGTGGFLSSTIQYLIGQGSSEKQLCQFVRKNLYGIDKDEYLAQLSRTHIGLLSGEVPSIACADSLAWEVAKPRALDDFPVAGEYDVVVTNPPFGANIVAASDHVALTYKLARKWTRQKATGRYSPTQGFQKNVPPQILFLERSIQLLKPGGRLGIVLPESLISSPRHRFAIDFVRDLCHLNLVAGMPENLFKTSGKGGTHTKTCLLVLERKKSARRSNGNRPIFMAEARWCGHDSRAKVIPYDDLPAISRNFLTTKQGRPLEPSHLGFNIKVSDIRDSVLAPRQYDPRITAEIELLAKTHQIMRFGDLVEKGILTLSTGNEVGKLAYGTGEYPFVRTSDISNWEIKIDTKHRLSKEIFESLREKQDVQPGDILMVRDGTYLIGTCALITEHDTEIVYQSHIYKIRMEKNDLGLTPYLLLAALSSAPVQRQIHSKRVTQDIIDSLGNRIMDLMLPISKDLKRQREISRLVERVIKMRVEARELARQAREMIVEH